VARSSTIREDLRDCQEVQDDLLVSVSIFVVDRRRLGESFESWECRLDSCSVALNAVTKNTYLMIVASDPRVGE
jgi:hypothetical protein